VLSFCLSAQAQHKSDSLPQTGFRQSKAFRLLNSVFNDTTSSAKLKLIAYPLVSYAPETSWVFGASALTVFYAKQNPKNRLSEISAMTFVTLARQYGLLAEHAIYTDKDKWFFLGKIRVQQFPLDYYGIGIQTPAEPSAIAEGFSVSVRERVLRKIKGGFYTGLQVDYNRLAKVDFTPKEGDISLPTAHTGSENLGLGLGLVYDKRHNVLNVREGFFAELGFMHFNEAWGSDYAYTNYFVDTRYFHQVTAQQVWASQFFLNAVSPSAGSEVPFNQLAFLGGENLMRGYYSGRFRDRAYTAVQTEYRFLPFPFSKRFGASAFLGVGTVAPKVSELRLRELKAAGGAGLRILLFPSKDIFVRLDVAATEEGFGYYLFVGEAF